MNKKETGDSVRTRGKICLVASLATCLAVAALCWIRGNGATSESEMIAHNILGFCFITLIPICMSYVPYRLICFFAQQVDDVKNMKQALSSISGTATCKHCGKQITYEKNEPGDVICPRCGSNVSTGN